MREKGEVKIAMTMGGTKTKSVIPNFSIVARYCSMANRRITYAGDPDFRVDM